LERYQPFLTEAAKQKKQEQTDTGWVNGLYVQKAIGSALPKGAPYPEKPLQLYGEVEKPASDDDEEVYVFTDADRFWVFANTFNKQFEGKSKQ